MSRNGLGPASLDKLEAALDTYGGDRTRWPAPLRLALSGLIAGNAEAQEMLKDAEAFDRLLDGAPQYDAARLGKLKERIATAAALQPWLVAARLAANTSPSGRRHHGLAATALAASLVLGVFTGQLKVVNSTADILLDGSAGYTNNSRQLAQTDEADNLLDEDLL